MKATDWRRQDAHIRVAALCARLGAIFGGAPALKTIALLDESIAAVRELFVARQQAHEQWRQAAADRREWRASLRERLSGIVHFSRAFDPGGEAGPMFATPPVESDQRLAADARMMHDKAMPLAEKFDAHGLDVSEIQALLPQIAELDTLIARQSAASRLAGDTSDAIAAAMSRGDKAVKALDRIVRASPLAQDPVIVGEWKSAKRAGRSRKDEADRSNVEPMPDRVA